MRRKHSIPNPLENIPFCDLSCQIYSQQLCQTGTGSHQHMGYFWVHVLRLNSTPNNDGHNPKQAVCPSCRFHYPEKNIYLVSEFVSSGKLKKNWNFWRLAFWSICWTSDGVWNMPHVAGCPLSVLRAGDRHGVGKRNYTSNVGKTT